MSQIVIDAREWSTSTGRYISNLVRQLEKLETMDKYTVLLKPSDLSAWKPTNPNFKKLACSHQEFTFGEQMGFKRQLDGLNADLVHFGMAHQPVRYRGASVTTIHDLTTLRFTNPSNNLLVFKVKQRIYKHVVKRVIRKSIVLIAPSHFVKEDLIRFSGVSQNKITVIHEAAALINDKSKEVQELVGQKFILYVGRPTPHKNLERLIKAFSSLQNQHPDLKLVLAGKPDANYKRLAVWVKKQTVNNVIFAGFVSEGQLRWLYENSAAYVFPSLSEGFGLPGLEAMLHGAPVVSSNSTCLPEIYGHAAHYFDPLNVQAMSSAINDVLTDESLRTELIRKGRNQAARYSWQRLAQQTLSVYRKALET